MEYAVSPLQRFDGGPGRDLLDAADEVREIFDAALANEGGPHAMLRLQPGRYVLGEPLERESAYLGEDVRAISGVSRL